MKKLLSIILTVLMLVTMIPFAPLTMAADTVTVYLKNDAGWRSTMYAYCWKENDSVRPLGNWPGTLMDKVEGESQLYAIDVPADTYAIIFNDGINQTPDLFLPTDGSNYYNNGTGEWTTISTRGHDHALTAGGEVLEFATFPAGATEISTAGNYYLTQDIELTDNLWIEVEGTVNLCLNGHSITAVEEGGNPVVVILKAGTLNLCDCQGGGCITSAEDLTFSGVRTLADTEFNMYSGEIKNNYYYAVECIDFNMYGGKLSGNKQAAVDVKGAFNMYGGEISGNSGEWGTVSVGNNGSFTMYDGEIKDNINKSTYWNSGTVYVQNGIFTMKGGKITGNTGGSGTGGVHTYGNFVMDGGEISGNSGYSGGVSVGIDSVFTMNGGKISGNKSNLGGGVYINERASFNMNGGEISGNTAEQGGGVFSTYDSAKINLKKGVITGNSATYAGGVGAQYANTPVEISGADVQIVNNTAPNYPDLRATAPVIVSAPLDSAKTKISLSVNGEIIAKPDGTNLTTLEGMEDCFIVSEEDGFIKCNEKGELELTEWNASISEKDGYFVVEAPHNGAYTITYQWYELNGDELTELEGETSDKLTADKIVIGKTYACKIYLDGEEKDLLTIKYPYRITHQPTAAEPYVELNDDTDATYRWYAVEGDKVEFTNENANPIDYYDGPTEYDPETGWNADFWSETGGYFFCVYLEEGEKITVEFNHPVYDEVGIWGYYENDGDYSYLNGETTVSLVAPFSDYFDIYAYGINADTRVKAYIENRIYTEIEGQTTATLTPTALGKYACEVTFADGTTEMSDTFEVTKLHDCDFSGEWKYDAEKHWKECTVDGCSETSEEAEHSFTDGKCSCGYTCPHSSYTDGVCDNCDYECPHEWGEGVLTRPTFESEGYYTYTCTLCGHSYTEPTEKADTTALNDVSMKVMECIGNSTLTQEAANEIHNSYLDILKNNDNIFDEFGFVRDNLVEEDQPAINAVTAELEKIVADAEEKIANGEYVKVNGLEEIVNINNALNKEITEKYGEEAVAELADKLSDEVNAKFDELYERAEALTGTKAENKEALDEIKAEMEALFAEIEKCLDGTHTIKYEESSPAKCEENAKESGTCPVCGEADEREVPGTALTHSFTKYEVTEEAECEKAGKEVAVCDHGCGATDEKEILALTHKDDDGDYKCDHGCGHEFEKPVDPTPGGSGEPGIPEEPADGECDHICHDAPWYIRIFWEIVNLFYRFFRINQVCSCGELHYYP